MTASLADRDLPASEPFGPDLVLVRESRVGDLIPAAGDRVLEASGVLVDGDRLFVIFDNTPDIGVLHADLSEGPDNRLIPQDRGLPTGYEDIARDPVTGNHYILIESLPRGDGYQARVEEFDPDFTHRGSGWLDFPLPSANKGLEGLTCLRRDGETYLLALCEGNFCRAGRAGRVPGGGRIHVFGQGRRNWHRVDTIRLPTSLRFIDYSSLSIRDGRLAVASQESSALWVGHLQPDCWEVAGPGSTFSFPRTPSGGILYRSVEGVSWLGERRLVAVSDRANRRSRQALEHGHGRRRPKEQMVHLFDLPEPALG